MAGLRRMVCACSYACLAAAGLERRYSTRACAWLAGMPGGIWMGTCSTGCTGVRVTVHHVKQTTKMLLRSVARIPRLGARPPRGAWCAARAGGVKRCRDCGSDHAITSVPSSRVIFCASMIGSCLVWCAAAARRPPALRAGRTGVGIFVKFAASGSGDRLCGKYKDAGIGGSATARLVRKESVLLAGQVGRGAIG